MAKAKEPKWKSQWPRSSDLATWFRCMLTKCDAIADDEIAVTEAHLPIESLAELGHVAEALKYVNRFLRRAPKDGALAIVRMARVGAEISLAAGDLPRMEKYLARMAATEPLNTRKCDAGFSINAVREFRAENGLLDPDEAIDDRQRLKAQFRRADRQFAEALAARKRKAATLAVAEMEQVASSHDDPWWRQQWTRLVIERYAALGDSAAVKRSIRKLDAELGWTTSAVYTAFAEAAASLGDQETADGLLHDALTDGKSEKRSSWRKGAVGAALDVQADSGRIVDAINEARKIRSPSERRKALGKLFAKERRWKEMRDVLTGVASPEEAADICWWIKFELPGGEVKQR